MLMKLHSEPREPREPRVCGSALRPGGGEGHLQNRGAFLLGWLATRSPPPHREGETGENSL